MSPLIHEDLVIIGLAGNEAMVKGMGGHSSLTRWTNCTAG